MLGILLLHIEGHRVSALAGTLMATSYSRLLKRALPHLTMSFGRLRGRRY